MWFIPGDSPNGPSASYPVRDLAHAANRPLRQFVHRLLRHLLLFFFSPFIRGFVWLFLIVSKDRQTKETTKVQIGVVLCGNRDHVPGLNYLPAKKIAGNSAENR